MSETKVTTAELKPTFGVVLSTIDLTLQNGTYADVPGATITLTPAVPSTIVVIATFDMDTPGSGYAGNGKINIDGADQTPTAILGAGATALSFNRGSAVTMIQANLTAASHTIKLRAQNSGSPSGIVRAPHTHFFYILFSQ